MLDLLDRSAELRARAARSSALRKNRMWNKPDLFSTVVLCAPTYAHRLLKSKERLFCHAGVEWAQDDLTSFPTESRRFKFQEKQNGD